MMTTLEMYDDIEFDLKTFFSGMEKTGFLTRRLGLYAISYDPIAYKLIVRLKCSVSDKARQCVVASDVTKCDWWLKILDRYNNRMIDMLYATVAMTAVNTVCGDCKKTWRCDDNGTHADVGVGDCAGDVFNSDADRCGASTSVLKTMARCWRWC